MNTFGDEREEWNSEVSKVVKFWDAQKYHFCPKCQQTAFAFAQVSYAKGEQDALRNLASAMKKILTPEMIQEIKDRQDPLGAFLRDLSAESVGRSVGD